MDANGKEELEQAQAAHEKLTDTKKSTDMLKNVQKALKEDSGIEVEVPEVTEEPEVEVKVETDIVAVSESAVVLPPGVVESSTTTTSIHERSRISSSSALFPQFVIL